MFEKLKTLEGTDCVTFGLVQLSEEEGMSGDQQKIGGDCGKDNSEENCTVNVEFLKGDVEGKTARGAAITVFKLERV